MTIETRIRELIEREMPSLIEVRRDLHAHPELGYEETRTSKVVQRELNAAGVEFANGMAGGTGVLGHLPGPGESAVGLRADMDALPIVEETGVPWASTHEGRMHACGHDGHTTMLIGAARVLGTLAKEGGLTRPVSFVFQPAEEGGAGGQRMVQDGCLRGDVLGTPVDRMFGLHGWPRMTLGTVGTRPGPLLAAADMFEIDVCGDGGHAAMPHHTKDPMVAAAAMVGALQSIAARNVDPLDSIVVSVTTINGGSAHNIIPDAVRLGGTVRTLQPETQALAKRRLVEIAEGIAAAHGCSAVVRYRDGYPVTLNDAGAVDEFNETARAAFGDERVEPVQHPAMGGEDFAYYCQEVPSCFFLLGLLRPGHEAMPQLHQATFDFVDEAMPVGIEAFCRLALREG
ncbi:MAG: M20 metallopeptidase family protein [Planctomycetota bacterium]|jgi:amidohydrolase